MGWWRWAGGEARACTEHAERGSFMIVWNNVNVSEGELAARGTACAFEVLRMLVRHCGTLLARSEGAGGGAGVAPKLPGATDGSGGARAGRHTLVR